MPFFVVELHHDYRSWPCPKLQLSSYLGVSCAPFWVLLNNGFSTPLLDSDPINRSERATDCHNDDIALSYASTIIETLQRGRDSERASHERTRKAAQSRIRHFEARIARLEAELGGCIFHTHRASHSSHGVDGTGNHGFTTSQEDDVILDSLAARNRYLEGEIKSIASQASISHFSHLNAHRY